MLRVGGFDEVLSSLWAFLILLYGLRASLTFCFSALVGCWMAQKRWCGNSVFWVLGIGHLQGVLSVFGFE